MNRLRNRLIAIFLAATLAPLAATWWIATSLIDHSLGYSSVDRLDRVSQSLERTGRQLYQQACETLRRDATGGRIAPRTLAPGDPLVREFREGGERERFSLAEDESLNYLVRRGGEVDVYSMPLGFSMGAIAREYREAREAISYAHDRDLRRGLLYAFASLAAAVWLISLAVLLPMAWRISRPIQQLTAGLASLAGGDLSTRVETGRKDEIGRAITAFNDMAAQLQQSRERLVYLTQMASWQVLARKTAHELKNSLTPIRLTMEEVIARRNDADQAFIGEAARIVVEEVESLERRLRAFSQFSAEPPVRSTALDVNTVVEERIALLKAGHPALDYRLRLDGHAPTALADEDLLKGILTNLLENAADAAGAGGSVMVLTTAADAHVTIEVHDSGPGLSEEARRSLFEPTISFKEHGMGLGLSIARKNALLLGGDILLVAGELGGAAFRVTLPVASTGSYQLSVSRDRERAGAGSPQSVQPSVPQPATGRANADS